MNDVMDERGVLYCSVECCRHAGQEPAEIVGAARFTTEEFGALCPHCDREYNNFGGGE